MHNDRLHSKFSQGMFLSAMFFCGVSRVLLEMHCYRLLAANQSVTLVRLYSNGKVAVKIVKRAGLPEDDEKALKDEVTFETLDFVVSTNERSGRICFCVLTFILSTCSSKNGISRPLGRNTPACAWFFFAVFFAPLVSVACFPPSKAWDFLSLNLRRDPLTDCRNALSAALGCAKSGCVEEGFIVRLAGSALVDMVKIILRVHREILARITGSGE